MSFKRGVLKPRTSEYRAALDKILDTKYPGSRGNFTIGLREFRKKLRPKMSRADIAIYEVTATGEVFIGEYQYNSWSLEFAMSNHLSEEEIVVFLVTERLTNATA